LTSAQKGTGGVGSRALIAATLAHFTNDGTSTMFTVLIVYYLSLPISLAYLGGAAAASNLVSGLVAERIGSWADNSGKRGMMMAAGIGMAGVATLIFAASFYEPQSAATTLLAGVMVLGIGLAFYHPLGGSIIAFASEGKSLPRQMGINGSFGSVGRALFPVLIVSVVGLFGAPVGLLSLGAGVLAVGGVIFWLSKGLDMFMVGERQKRPPSGRSLKPYRKFVIALTAVFFVDAVFGSGITTYIPSYYEQVYGSAGTAGLITSIILLAPIIGQPVQGHIASRLGSRRALQITVTSSAAVVALFLLFQNVVLEVLSLSVFAFFYYTGFPVILGYASLVTPRESITRVNAIVWGLGSTMGSALGSALGGTLGGAYGFHTSFAVCWGFGLLAVALLPLVPGKVDQRPESATL
jgi:MFS transporter, FSR family, fosmidomycin resistance protein